MRSLLLILSVTAGLMLAACASEPARLSSVGLYGDVSALPARGASAVRVYSGTFDEVWDASRQVVERLGLFIEESDRAKGKFNGNGNYQFMCLAGPCAGPVVFGLFFKEIGGREPRVQVTAHVVLPQGGGGRQGGHPEFLVNRIVGDVQKSLAASR